MFRKKNPLGAAMLQDGKLVWPLFQNHETLSVADNIVLRAMIGEEPLFFINPDRR